MTRQILHARLTAPNVYDYYIGGYIGQKVDCMLIAEEMLYLRTEKQADRINIHLNTEGGNVMNGVSVISEILNSDIPVHTYNDGYAMSMGGYIWLSAKKENRHMCDFSILMLHAARMLDENGNVVIPTDPEEAKFTEVVNNQLLTILVGSTGKDIKTLQKILSKDSFFSAEDCVREGFCNDKMVKSFGRKPDINSAFSASENIQRIAAFYNDINFNSKSETMKGLFARMKLREEASESAAIATFDELEAKFNKSTSDLVAMTGERDAAKKEKADVEAKLKIANDEIATMKAEKEAGEKAQVEAYVDAAITAGKFGANKKAELIISATRDFASFKFVTDSIRTAAAPDIKAQLSIDREPQAAKFGIEAKNLNYEWLDKNDMPTLQKIKKEEPDLYAVLKVEYEMKFENIGK